MNLANNLSILRILFAPVFVTSLVYFSAERPYLHAVSLVLFGLACLTDALDGYLARKFNQVTDFGAYLDPIADKLLLVSGFLSLSFMSHLPHAMRIPAWVTISVVARDLVILLGATTIFITTGALKARPLFIGKITTVFQMATLFLALTMSAASVLNVFFFATFFLNIASGIQYIRLGGKIVQAS